MPSLDSLPLGEAFRADPFADLPDPDPSIRTPAPALQPLSAPSAPPVRSGEPPKIALGRVATLPAYRLSNDLDGSARPPEPEEPKPLPAVSSLRWPPRLGLLLGILLSAWWWVQTDPWVWPAAEAPAGLTDVRLVAFEVRPYPGHPDRPLWVAKGMAETRARGHSEGVQVHVRARSDGRTWSSGEGYVGVAVPPPTLWKGMDAVNAFWQRTHPPAMPPASRRPFWVALPRLDMEGLRFDVEFRVPEGSTADESARTE